jgi:hypothetical protein
MNKPTMAILDGDILAYRAAFWAESEGVEYLEERVNHDIQAWTPEGVTKVYVAMSCSRSDNFRRKVWPAYKVHRDDSGRKAPEHLDYAEELVTKGNVVRMDCLEADDLMGMGASSGKSIAVTIDKDLRAVPGWHWNPDKEPEPVFIDEQTADYNFHAQWLTGDSTDNIPGIWKCGPAKAKKILESTQPVNWSTLVMATYEKAKGKDGESYNYEYCVAMAQCVRILRSGELDENNQPKLWFPKVGATD